MKLRTAILAGVAAVLTAVLAAQAQVPGVNSTLQSVFTLAYDNSTMKPTYSATIASVATGTAMADACTLSGSASKVVKVRRVLFGGVATAAVTDPAAIVKRSSNDTGGTNTLIPIASYDSSNAAGTAVAESFTVNATAFGTLVTEIVDMPVTWGNLTTGQATVPVTQFLFGQLGQPIVLRNAAEQIAVSIGNGSTLGTYAGGLYSCTFEWTEE